MGNRYNVGTGWGFPPEFSNNGQKVQLVSDEIEIKQALEILFTTTINERIYRSNYGCDLKRFLFEEVNSSLAKEIKSMIKSAVYDYEPRIKVFNIEINESDNNGQQLLINVYYTILESNTTDSYEFTLDIY